MKKRITSEFDEYSRSRQVDVEDIERRFVHKAYRSSSMRDCYVLVRSKEAAEYLKMNVFSIGKEYILSRGQNNESNLKVP